MHCDTGAGGWLFTLFQEADSEQDVVQAIQSQGLSSTSSSKKPEGSTAFPNKAIKGGPSVHESRVVISHSNHSNSMQRNLGRIVFGTHPHETLLTGGKGYFRKFLLTK